MSLGYFTIITDHFHSSPTLGKLFAEKNECFYHHRFCFRLNISTNNALMSITENIQARLDDNEFAAGVFADLKKAFETIDHEIIIRKVENYGVRGIAKD